MLLVSSCSCLYPIRWSQELSWEWRCSWSSADRRCSNYIWVINYLIVYESAPYITDLTVYQSESLRCLHRVQQHLEETCCTMGNLITEFMWPSQTQNLPPGHIWCPNDKYHENFHVAFGATRDIGMLLLTSNFCSPKETKTLLSGDIVISETTLPFIYITLNLKKFHKHLPMTKQFGPQKVHALVV